MKRGLMDVFTELLTYERGNEFYRFRVPRKWHGKSFSELLRVLKETHNAILVAACSDDGQMVVNPEQYTFSLGDEMVVIARGALQIEDE